ncbi:MAG: deoxyguanosinetriphosphate triphosphohydrolase [Clostridiaceae bacterium]|nr:deoxyguanosinetriphosphate triphosphohydrolase [Clostridiaceae bacterium]
MSRRERLEHNERLLLSEYACLSENSKGRERPEVPDEIRTCFMRDRDRIIHCKSFRRLKHKTQCFISPEGDHYRTRLTHTLEVSQISRTIAKALDLNEDLAEAIAMGHDLGHTPFGHAGESALNDVVPGGFRHNEHSLRIVERLEKNGRGLNLTYEVRQGILRHTGDDLPETQEGQIIRFADRIAYINHDIDDAIRGEILSEKDIPREITDILGTGHSRRINTLVVKMVEYGEKNHSIGLDFLYQNAMDALREFMFENVYRNPKAKSEESKGIDILKRLYVYFCQNPEKMPPEYAESIEKYTKEEAVRDYVAGMTDRFAISKYEDIFVPKSWAKY